MSVLVVERADLRRVGGPLRDRAQNRATHWRERAGLLLELRDERGNTGRGEASPLPGYSRDTLADSEEILQRLVARPLPSLHPERPLAGQIAAVWREHQIGPDMPAARFAVETALLDLVGQALAMPVAQLLTAAEPERPERPDGPDLPVAALIVDDAPATAAVAARQAVERGYRCIKAKIGRPGDRADLELVARLRDAVGAETAIRLDANAAWSPAEAEHRLRQLAPCSIEEPVEQPVAPDAMIGLGPQPVPIAADESLHDPEADLAALFASGTCAAIVLKPMVLGGLLRCVDLAQRARAHGLEPIASHLFDGPVALAAASELALALRSRHAVGLAPHAGLAPWPVYRMPQHHQTFLRAAPRTGLGLEPLTPRAPHQGESR